MTEVTTEEEMEAYREAEMTALLLIVTEYLHLKPIERNKYYFAKLKELGYSIYKL